LNFKGLKMNFSRIFLFIFVFIIVIFSLFYANFSVFAENLPNESANSAETIAETPVVKPTADEREMLKLLNDARAERGLPQLIFDAQLTQLAREKAEDMVNNGYFAHISPNFGSPFDMMKNAGVMYTSAGENIAENTTVAGANNMLMLSDSHRANMLNPQFSRVGVGIMGGPREFKTIVQMFIEE